MTITIADGRGALWQWDTGRRLRVGSGVEQIHYQNRALGGSVDVAVGTDGTAIIPDELLQDCHTLTAYVYVTDDTGAYTMEQQDFIVHKRAKPAGYVYTPTDQMTLQTIQRQIGDLADLTTAAKDTLVAAINEVASAGDAGSMALRVADGYVQYSTDGGSTWQNLIAVAELKGADGSTPHIGDNGNWYLGTTDTGKPSRGAKGDPGKNGSDASVTEASITSALGYKPVAPGDIPVVPTADISANTSARHSHTNKDVLDSITAADKTKLNGVENGATKTIVDTAMSDTSTNPVQNKVIKKYIDDHSAGTGGTGGAANAVLYTAQTLEAAQQLQARQNINAAGVVMPQFQGFLSLAPANAPLGTGVGLSPSGSGNDFTLDISDVNEGTPTLLTGVKTPTDADTNAAATVEYVKTAVPTALKNPNALTIKIGGTTVTYDGSAAKTVTIADGSEVAY